MLVLPKGDGNSWATVAVMEMYIFQLNDIIAGSSFHSYVVSSLKCVGCKEVHGLEKHDLEPVRSDV